MELPILGWFEEKNICVIKRELISYKNDIWF